MTQYDDDDYDDDDNDNDNDNDDDDDDNDNDNDNDNNDDRSTDTILGEAGDPTELFQLTDCEDQPLLSIWKKASVKFVPVPNQEEWRQVWTNQRLV